MSTLFRASHSALPGGPEFQPGLGRGFNRTDDNQPCSAGCGRPLFAFLMASLLVAAGCKVGPNYQPPALPAHANTLGMTDQTPGRYSTNAVIRQWWREFNDPILQEMLALAAGNNRDLRVAAARLEEVKALARLAKYDLLPSTSANADYFEQKQAKDAVPGLASSFRKTALFDVKGDVTWELDLFGRLRRAREAVVAELGSLEAERAFVLLSVRSEVVRNYFSLRGLQRELAVTQRNATNQQETLRLTQARLGAGMSSELDVTRARAQWNNTLARTPLLQSSIDHAIHRLGVLVGQSPDALRERLKPVQTMPGLPTEIPIGNPTDLLRRRPDIRAAERQLASATAQIGIDAADLFPRVTFNGSLGLQASRLERLSNDGANHYGFGPSISWVAFDLFKVRARVKAAGARAEAALARYEGAVLTALEETENALVDFDQARRREAFLTEAFTAAQASVNLARQRYEHGIIDFLALLDAERSLLEAESQMVQGETQSATTLVEVFKTLGAGGEAVANTGHKP